MNLFFSTKAPIRKWLQFLLLAASLCSLSAPIFAQKGKSQVEQVEAPVVEEVELASSGLFARAWNGGFVVFSVLLILMTLSILSWAVAVVKWVSIRKVFGDGEDFAKVFWKSRSLNELNSKLSSYSYSPVREVFRTGYSELKSIAIKDVATNEHVGFMNSALESLHRSLLKARSKEKRQLERFLSVLSISASVSPFIGLFGTVWGIMNAFEGIAQTGSASLSTVAPGVSEALIATAFGLFAAIPAVVGYNLAIGKIRSVMVQVDGFVSDFLNVVQKHLMSERAKHEESKVNH